MLRRDVDRLLVADQHLCKWTARDLHPEVADEFASVAQRHQVELADALGEEEPIGVDLRRDLPAEIASKFLPASDYARAVAVNYGDMEKAQAAFGTRYLNEVK